VIEKCKYFNNARTAVTLMIDDFVPAAVTTNGQINPSNDWGYLYDKENSLYRYLNEQLFSRYPEIKGTFFIPLKSHRHLDQDKGYTIHVKDFDKEFGEFAGRIKDRFDFAFHGIAHTYREQSPEGERTRYEFQQLTLDDLPQIKKEIEAFRQISGLSFTGGKYPGNRGNEFAERIIEEIGFRWWTQRKLFHVKNPQKLEFTRTGIKQNILDIPQTYLGDAFSQNIDKSYRKFGLIKLARDKFKMLKNERRLIWLYENSIPVTIQEHFQNATTRGTRQRPNIFDDTDSIAKIYSLLRGSDIWYASCGELAHYQDCYTNSKIRSDANSFTVEYNGSWDTLCLSIRSDAPRLIYPDPEGTVQGRYKNGEWIYTVTRNGKYTIDAI